MQCPKRGDSARTDVKIYNYIIFLICIKIGSNNVKKYRHHTSRPCHIKIITNNDSQ